MNDALCPRHGDECAFEVVSVSGGGGIGWFCHDAGRFYAHPTVAVGDLNETREVDDAR